MATLITLLTDFGTADSYVGEVRGVLLSQVHGVVLADITHQVPPGDVRAAQYILSRVWQRFPQGTVHLGKPLPYTGKDVLGGAYVPRRALVRDVGEHYAVHLRQQHTPHLADVAIGGPEVREQGDEGGHTRLNAERETRNAEHAYRAPPSCSAFRVPTSALSYRRRAPRPPQPE